MSGEVVVDMMAVDWLIVDESRKTPQRGKHSFNMTCAPGLREPTFSPSQTMFYNPIQESTLETNIAPGLFAFDPFMPQDLVAFGQELLV